MEQSASPAIAPPRLPPESGAPAGSAVLVPEGEIEGLSFRGVALPSEDCSRLSVQGCRFSGCRLGGAVFRGSRFTDVLFRNCDLSVADLQGASFFRVRFEECKIAGAGFAETTLQHVVFGHCKGEFVNFSRSRLRSVRFAGAQLRGGVFAVRAGDGRLFGNAPRGDLLRRFRHSVHPAPRGRFARAEGIAGQPRAGRRAGAPAGRRDRGVTGRRPFSPIRNHARGPLFGERAASCLRRCGEAYFRPSFLAISFGMAFLFTMIEVVL